MSSRIYVFGDESGSLDFREGRRGASHYYILTTVVLDDCSAGDELLALRRQLCWEGLGNAAEIHATEDQQQVRDRIFSLLRSCDMRIDASIFTKANIREHIRNDHDYLYKLTWLYHLR